MFRMISSHENGLPNAHAEDLAPRDLLLATDADPASAPGMAVCAIDRLQHRGTPRGSSSGRRSTNPM